MYILPCSSGTDETYNEMIQLLDELLEWEQSAALVVEEKNRKPAAPNSAGKAVRDAAMRGIPHIGQT